MSNNSIVIESVNNQHFKYERPEGITSGSVLLMRNTSVSMDTVGCWQFKNMNEKFNLVRRANRIALNSPKKQGIMYEVVLLYGVKLDAYR